MCLLYWMLLQLGEKFVRFVKGKLFFLGDGMALPLQDRLLYDTCKIYYMKMFNFDRIMKVHHQGHC